ncbi:MAG: hypothetical protein H5T99_08205, partial [Moorella sp. (in: Bacteria)]|nr:hypothetical protein [Moorella sp. (in: firmicutes)]
MRECLNCLKFFEPVNSLQKYCPDCINDPEVQRERSRLRVHRLRERRKQGVRCLELAAKDEQGKTCPICTRRFIPRNGRQVWCLECRKKGRQAARTRYMRGYMKKYRRQKRAKTPFA